MVQRETTREVTVQRETMRCFGTKRNNDMFQYKEKQ